VVDEVALVEALESGHLAAAGLDVFVGEPYASPRLLGSPHLVLLPHIGSATFGTRRRMTELACNGLCEVLAGREPPNLVAAP
jgi:glyoxylate reductase